jgi:hypothetical protein
VEAKTQANKRPKKYFMPFSLPLAHLPNWHPVPVEIRSNVGAAMAASLTDKARLYVGQPHIIGPRIRAHGDAVAAAVVGALHEQPTHAHLAHLGKGDLCGEVGHDAALYRRALARSFSPGLVCYMGFRLQIHQ